MVIGWRPGELIIAMLMTTVLMTAMAGNGGYSHCRCCACFTVRVLTGEFTEPSANMSISRNTMSVVAPKREYPELACTCRCTLRTRGIHGKKIRGVTT